MDLTIPAGCPYHPTPPDLAAKTVCRSQRMKGGEIVTQVVAPVMPPPHDPLPKVPWVRMPTMDETWWALPWLLLPSLEAIAAQAGLIALENHQRGHAGSSERAAFARLWAALLNCSSNFHGPRMGAADWDQVKDARRLELALGFRPLLPKIRFMACVRLSPKSPWPASLGRALARLRVLVAMCDHTDMDADPYWVNRVKTAADLASLAGKMGAQVDGKWERRESEWEGAYGGR